MSYRFLQKSLSSPLHPGGPPLLHSGVEPEIVALERIATTVLPADSSIMVQIFFAPFMIASQLAAPPAVAAEPDNPAESINLKGLLFA